MNIALIAHDSRKELMTQFCIAYGRILSKHRICATDTTGRLVENATGIPMIRLLTGSQGGLEQIATRIQCNEVDILIFFRDPLKAGPADPRDAMLLRLCDAHQVPYATNIATAEVLIMSLDRGDLDWRVYAGGEAII